MRRADINVITAFINKKEVPGAHDIKVIADRNIKSIELKEIDGVLLPGGMPGAKNLNENKVLLKLIKELNQKNKMIAAICAAPMVLETANVIDNIKATSYPGFNKEMPSCIYQEKRVVIDDNIITGRGPGVALEFALSVVEYLLSKEKANQLKQAMLTNF